MAGLGGGLVTSVSEATVPVVVSVTPDGCDRGGNGPVAMKKPEGLGPRPDKDRRMLHWPGKLVAATG